MLLSSSRYLRAVRYQVPGQNDNSSQNPRNANYFEFFSKVRKKSINAFEKQGIGLPAMRGFTDYQGHHEPGLDPVV
jgi:hypothetical protein